jgi:hypothetical protein
MSNYLYILQRNDKKGTNVYKIGMTEQSIFNRINKEASYRDCFIIETRSVDNGRKAENELKTELKLHNIKRCKDEDPIYQGIEDYIINDLNYALKIFNDVCDKNSDKILETNNTDQKIDINPLLKLKEEIYCNNFESLIVKRKLLIEFLGTNKKNALNSWYNNLDKILKPIEIISGLNQTKNNTRKTFLIDTNKMFEYSGFNKHVTITKFKNFISNICTNYFSKYGKVIWKNEYDSLTTTSAQLYLMNPEDVMLLLPSKIIIDNLQIKFTSDFIKLLLKYDKEDYVEIINSKLTNYDNNIIEYLRQEHCLIKIDNNINTPIYNHNTKLLTIKRNDFEKFEKFRITFKNNTNIDYELIIKYLLLTSNNCEEFILYHQNLNTILRCAFNENNDYIIDLIVEFMYNKIYVLHNVKNVLYANKFKTHWYSEFEIKYNNIHNLSDNIKNQLYNKLDEYISKNNKLKQSNLLMSCKY